MLTKKDIEEKRKSFNANNPDEDYDISIYNSWRFMTRRAAVWETLCIILAAASLMLVVVVW